MPINKIVTANIALRNDPMIFCERSNRIDPVIFLFETEIQAECGSRSRWRRAGKIWRSAFGIHVKIIF